MPYVLIAALAVGATLVVSPVAQRAVPPPNFDIRLERSGDAGRYLERATSSFAASTATAAAAHAAGMLQLQADFGNSMEVTASLELGTAEVIGMKPGAGFLTGPSTDRAATMREFMTTYADAYGLPADVVRDLPLVASYVNPAGNMAWVELEQRINGLPVFRGLIRGGFTARGELVRTTGPLAPGLDAASLPFVPSLSPAAAVSHAAANVGWQVPESSIVERGRRGGAITLAGPSMASDAKAWLLYFPLAPGVARLAWATEVWGDPDAFLVVLDAEDGTVLFRKNMTEYQTQTATYAIYNNDSPAPMSPSTALPGSGTQAPFIVRTLVTLIGNEGVNAFNLLGWMTDGTNSTDGNNVEAGIDRDGTNGVDAPVTGSDRVFDFAYNPETDVPTTPAYQQGEVTDMFFWTNAYHDRLYLLGFTEAARNFQHDNFSRGGVGGDRVSAEAQDTFPGCNTCTNNANFSTPSDGSRGRMQMYIFPGPTPDRTSALEHDVLLHELTHGTSNRLHNNASGMSAGISRGMGEGWSDFYGRALLGTADEDPNGIYSTGGWLTHRLSSTYVDNYYYGIRRFPYAVKTNVGANGKPHNPLTFADIDSLQIVTTDGAFARSPISINTAFEVHNVGEVWAMALFEVRARFINRLGFETGNQRVLQFVTDGMKLDPTNPSFLQGRNSILAAAAAGGGTAADIADIWAGFAARGMGFGARETSITQSLARVVEAFDVPGLTPSSTTLVAESFPNGRLDAGEQVTMSLCVGNVGAAASGNVTGTLLTSTGVASPSGPQGYGSIPAGGTTCRNYTFTVGTFCGALTAATLQVAESGGPTRTLVYDLIVGSLTAFFSENFDGVATPDLPAGWTTSTLSGAAAPFATSAGSSDSAPNKVFAESLSIPGDNVLTSPTIAVPAGASRVSFRHYYNTETLFDGGVLEISIAGGAFQDILAAGGTLFTGGYNGTLSTSSSNPLPGRSAWTGSSFGYVTSMFGLPSAAAGQNIVLRWRLGSDDIVRWFGWSVDSVSLGVLGCSNGPVITTQPLATQGIGSGQTATLSVTAGGDAPLTYQWYQGSSPSTATPIGGATASSFTTPALTSNASYWVRVSNPVGSVNSNTASITINPGPAISTHPRSRSVNTSFNASFFVAAAGTPSPTFQWQVSTNGGATWTNLTNTSPYSGVTTSALSITSATLALSGSWYRAVATNINGSVASTAAMLTVLASSPATMCPAGLPVYAFHDGFERTNASWTATTTGAGTWSRGTTTIKTGMFAAFGSDVNTTSDSQWTLAPTALPAGARLFFDHSYSMESTFDGGVIEYSVDGGVTWIDAGHLIDSGAAYSGTIGSLSNRPGFTSSSGGYVSTRADLSALAGKNTAIRFRVSSDFTVGATGWFLDNVAIYACSSAASAPVFATDPASQTITTTGTAVLTAVAGGNPDPTYQWQVSTDGGTVWTPLTNTPPYSGVATGVLTIASPSTALNGRLHRAVATNANGSATSNPATLTVLATNAPVFTSQPSNAVVAAGGNATFTVAVTGSPSPPLQWQMSTNGGGSFTDLINSFPHSGVTTPTLTVTGPTVGMSGNLYRAVATNANGSATSTSALLTVLLASGAEMVLNGNFNNGITSWSVFEPPDIVHNSGVGGRFEYFKASPTTSPSGQAVIFQSTNQPVQLGLAVATQFDIGNSSGVRKRISVLVIDADFSDLSVCTFWLQPNVPIRTYRMRTHPTKAWTNAAIYFYAATSGSDGGNYLLDNVSMKTDPGVQVNHTDCVDPTAPPPSPGPASANLIANGDFSNGIASWGPFFDLTHQVTGGVFEFIRPGTPGVPAGGILQSTNQAMAPAEILTATFQFGNSSPVRKRVTILLHDLDFTDLTACTFWLAPGQALSNFAMRSFTTKAWTNATLSIYAATTGLEQWTRLDNVTLSRTPGSAVQGTECFEPGSAPEAHEGLAPTITLGLKTPGSNSLVGSGGFIRSAEASTSGSEGDWRIEATSTGRSVLLWAEPIDLINATSATLTFQSKLSSATSAASVQVSLDGVTWETIAEVPPSGTWATVSVDLSAFIGQVIYVRLVFDGTAPGVDSMPDTWLIDDVVISIERSPRADRPPD